MKQIFPWQSNLNFEVKDICMLTLNTLAFIGLNENYQCKSDQFIFAMITFKLEWQFSVKYPRNTVSKLDIIY